LCKEKKKGKRTRERLNPGVRKKGLTLTSGNLPAGKKVGKEGKEIYEGHRRQRGRRKNV